MKPLSSFLEIKNDSNKIHSKSKSTDELSTGFFLFLTYRTMSRFSTVKSMWFTLDRMAETIKCAQTTRSRTPGHEQSLFCKSIRVIVPSLWLYSQICSSTSLNLDFVHFLRAWFWILVLISTVVLISSSSDKFESYLWLISTKFDSFLFCILRLFSVKLQLPCFFFCILRLFSLWLPLVLKNPFSKKVLPGNTVQKEGMIPKNYNTFF